MRAALSVLVTLCRAAVGIAFAVLIFAVMVQVIGRSIVGSSVVWTEELTRYALLYLVAFGAGLSLRSGDLVNVDLAYKALPGRWPARAQMLAMALTAGLCLALLWPAWRYTSIGAFQTSPALGLRMDVVHATVLVLLAGLALFALMRLVALARGRETP